MAKCLIGDFHIQRPAYAVDHSASVRWLAAAHAKSESEMRRGTSGSTPSAEPFVKAIAEPFDEPAFRHSMERHIARFGCGPESLASRGHDLEDFLHTEWDQMRIFNLNKSPRGGGMESRMQVFSEIADRMLEGFYPEGCEAPEEMIHVSCTGYVAPSAVQKLIVNRGWSQRTKVMHAYHMGCYAAMPALRMASAFLEAQKPNAGRIDIVHTEACTLHLDPGQHSPEQLVVQSLFADGHIRYSIKALGSSRGLELLGTHEELIPGSLGAMGWILGDLGMRMILARDVPDLIAASLKDFLKRMFSEMHVDAAEAFGPGLFAIHPGGPRIIDKVASLLELAPHQIAASRTVLRACGNMSSATLPHIWANMVADSTIPSGTLITSLAFGPGLTVYGAILRKV